MKLRRLLFIFSLLWAAQVAMADVTTSVTPFLPLSITLPTTGQCLTYNGAFWVNSACGTASGAPFSGISAGTNGTPLVVGSGGSLSATGTGTIAATSVPATGVTAGALPSGVTIGATAQFPLFSQNLAPSGTVTGVPISGQQFFSWNGAISGSVSGQSWSANQLYVNNDTMTNSGPNGLISAFEVDHYFTGSNSVQTSYYGTETNLYDLTNTTQQSGGVVAAQVGQLAHSHGGTASNNLSGALYGLNPNVRMGGGMVFGAYLIGQETDVALYGGTLSGVSITGTGGQFSVTASATMYVGQVVFITGTYGGTGSITGYAGSNSYLISVTNGTTTFTLTTTTGSAIVTTTGTPTGLSYAFGASVGDKYGQLVVQLSNDTVPALYDNLAYVASNYSATPPGWDIAFSLGGYSGHPTMAPNGSIVGVWPNGQVRPATGVNAGTTGCGVDFAGLCVGGSETFTTAAFASSGFKVDPTGRVTATAFNGVTATNTVSGCTGTASSDTALLAAATAVGGLINVASNCTINATVALNSNTVLNLNGYTITGAVNTSWSGSTVAHFFSAASSATNITVQNGNFQCPASATGAVHILQFFGTNSHIWIVNNYFNANNACGDAEATPAATDVHVVHNTAIGVSNACWDVWQGSTDVEIADNYCTTGTGTSAIYGILWTGFNTADSAGSLTTHANIHDNHIYLNNQATFGDVGIYLQGYATCTSAAADYADVHDNEIFIGTGIWAQPIRADGCANHGYIHDNVIYSDGTASTLPAIEAKATTTDIHIDNNHASNFSAPTSGSDMGVFNNESANGTLLNNTCTGGSCSIPNYGGQVASTINHPIGQTPTNLYVWGVPVLLPSSGSMANNGVLTLTTATFNTLANAYVYLPASAIYSGSTAGVYYMQCTTTTACVVKNNVLASGAPVLIASPTAFATTGPGAYTQTTSSMVTLLTLSIPAHTLGADGYMDIRTHGNRTNNADVIEEEWTLGGTEIALANTASVNWYGMKRTYQNMASEGLAQIMGASTTGATDDNINANGVSYLGIGTNNTQNLVIEAQINTATDQFLLGGGNVLVSYAP